MRDQPWRQGRDRNASFTMHDNCVFKGAMVFETVSIHDFCDVYYDEALGTAGAAGSAGTQMVQ